MKYLSARTLVLIVTPIILSLSIMWQVFDVSSSINVAQVVSPTLETSSSTEGVAVSDNADLSTSTLETTLVTQATSSVATSLEQVVVDQDTISEPALTEEQALNPLLEIQEELVLDTPPVPYEYNPVIEPLVLEERTDCLSLEARRLFENPGQCFAEFDTSISTETP